MGHVRDRWTRPGPSGRRVRTDLWGRGRRWQARWVLPDGTERTSSHATKDAAEAHVQEMDVASRAGEWVRDDRSTLGVYAARWGARQVHHAASTVATRDRHLAAYVLPVLGDRRVASLTRGDVVDLVASWSHAAASQRVTWAYLSAVLKAARADGLTSRDLTTGVRLPPVPDRFVAPLSVAQVAALAGAMHPVLAGAVWFAAGTGVRPGELRGLTVDRLDLVAGSVLVDRQLVGGAGMPVWGPTKTRTARRVSLAAVSVDRLREHLEEFGEGPGGLVFTAPRSRRALTRSHLQGAWQAAVGRAGLELGERSGWHGLRHHHASLLIAAGLSPRAVADRLGHRDVAETLRTYTHLWPSDDARARDAIEAAYRGP